MAKQQKGEKLPLCGIAGEPENDLFYTRTLNSSTMKLLSESFRNFFEGFASFYTSLYDEMKKW